MNEQQRLLTAIWSNDSSIIAETGLDRQGIDIYRRNLLANAQRALKISFATVFTLLDSDVCERILRQFLTHSPPCHGDWAQWGEAFPDFLAGHTIANDLPYLADCARLDWLMHKALHGCDQILQQDCLLRLGQYSAENIYIDLNQNVALITTCLPISEIYCAHHHTDQQRRDEAMQAAKTALAMEPIHHGVMIYRPEFEPKVMRITSGESCFLQGIIAGFSLSQALDSASAEGGFSFQQWLTSAIQNNIIYNVTGN